MFKKRLALLLSVILMISAVLPFTAGDVYAGKPKGGLKDATITISPLTYNGQIQKPVITVTIGQVTLVEGTDYDLEYQNAASINAGKYKVTIVGKGNYNGKVNEQYTIDPKQITPSVTLSKKSFVYNGAMQQPTVTAVKDDTLALTESDYTVSYADGCLDVGAYGVTVTMKGNYTGTKTVNYKINPKGTSIRLLTKGSKLIKVKWKRQTALMSKSNITGYQIRLGTNRKLTKNKKIVTVKGYTKYTKKVTKLLGGKKYYVKIRTYMTVNGVKYFSKWSKAKAIVTKP